MDLLDLLNAVIDRDQPAEGIDQSFGRVQQLAFWIYIWMPVNVPYIEFNDDLATTFEVSTHGVIHPFMFEHMREMGKTLYSTIDSERDKLSRYEPDNLDPDALKYIDLVLDQCRGFTASQMSQLIRQLPPYQESIDIGGRFAPIDREHFVRHLRNQYPEAQPES